MFRILKKHANKVLVFFINLLLMAIAVLVIKQKEETKYLNETQNKLINDNSSLADENEKLKSDLQSLGGALNASESKAMIKENTVGSSTPNTPNSINATNPSNNVPSKSTAGANISKTPPAAAMPMPNSMTKTS